MGTERRGGGGFKHKESGLTSSLSTNVERSAASRPLPGSAASSLAAVAVCSPFDRAAPAVGPVGSVARCGPPPTSGLKPVYGMCVGPLRCVFFSYVTSMWLLHSRPIYQWSQLERSSSNTPAAGGASLRRGVGVGNVARGPNLTAGSCPSCCAALRCPAFRPSLMLY